MTGGTHTVDKYGYFGNDDDPPVINPPEAGIPGLGAILGGSWVVDGEIAVRRNARFKAGSDHRICDGGDCGRFVICAALCEKPARIVVHS
jgi:pyruvate dehydrogenase E2 component (dihydrolipoamide acetyltransferase)